MTLSGPVNARLAFAVVDEVGSLWGLPGSSPQASTNVWEIDGPVRVHAHSPVGYIDSIREVLLDSEDNRTWLPNLLSTHPRELLDLVESGEGRFLATAFAEGVRLAREQPFGTRWADRFALAAYGDVTPTSDLTHFDVVRPNPNRHDRPDALAVPEMQHHGVTFDAIPSSVMLPMPSDEWLTFNDARVQDGGTILTSDALVVYEHAADPIWDFVGGQWQNVFGTPVKPEHVLVMVNPPADESIPEAILLSGRHDANWYHWFVEYLPRALDADSRFAPDIPFLLTPRVPATGREALARLSNRPVIVADPDQTQGVGRLHVTAPVAQVLDTTRVPWSKSLSVNAAPLRAMRQAFRSEIVPEANGERVFLLRKSGHRRVLNETELTKIAVDRGFRLVDPAGLTFDEQIELYSRTTRLVSAGGAVMANYLLLPPQSKILALTSHALTDFILPAVLAQVSDATFSYVAGPSKTARSAMNEKSWIHEDFTVRPSDFARALDQIS